MADLSYTVRYSSTIISPCLQFTSTTTIKIPPCAAHWGKIPAHLVRSRGLCVRVAPMWRPVCGTVLGTGEWPPVRSTVFVSTLREGFAGSHYLPPPLSPRYRVHPTGCVHQQSSGIIKIYKHTLKWSENVEGRNAAVARSNRCDLRPPRFSPVLTQIFSPNVF